MLPRAVLFDFDGVLAVTENIHIAAWERTFADLGLEVAAEECAKALGQDDRAFLKSAFEHLGFQGGDYVGWAERKRKLVAEWLADVPRIDPGAEALARRLRQMGVGLAVVTRSPRAHVKLVLRGAGLLDEFRIVTAEDFTLLGFPGDPQGHRKALRRLKVPKAAAVALVAHFEGHLAAETADIRPIVVGNTKLGANWARMSGYIESLGDVDGALSAISRMMARPWPPWK